jgi:tetratricopeptide (TPR) repeat protein
MESLLNINTISKSQLFDVGKVVFIYIVLVLTTFIAYEPMRHNDFIDVDDLRYVTENPQVKAGITKDSIVWAFTTGHASNWHPLTWLSHMLDCQLFGLNPFWHHLTSLLFHTANTLLLFWIFKRMSGNIWASAFIAAVFALHPTHVESVAWAAERKDVLSGFFWMLTIAAYILYTEKPVKGRYFLVIVLFGLGLMAKPMLVTLPFVLLLLDYWPLKRFQSKEKRSSFFNLILEKMPLIMLIVVSSIITFLVQRKGGAISSEDIMTFNIRVSNALVSYFRYIGKTIYPANLSILYLHQLGTMPLWKPIISFLALVLITIAVLYNLRKRAYLFTGWFWYVGTLVPVIGIVQVGFQAFADRYTYIPTIGISLIAVWGIEELLQKRRYREYIFGISAAVVLTALLISTRVQVSHWRDNIAIHEHSLSVTKDNYVLLDSYGLALLKEGRIQEAIEQFDKSLSIEPDLSGTRAKRLFAYQALARNFVLEEEYEEAVKYYNRVLEIETNQPEIYNELAHTFSLQRKYEQAIVNYRKALKIEPDNAVSHANLAEIYNKQGNLEKAVEHYVTLLQTKPDFAVAHGQLGYIFAQQNKMEQAIKHYQEAIRIKPDWLELMNNLAWILATCNDNDLRDGNKALKLAQKACELTDYQNYGFLDTLAAAYAETEDYTKAVETAQKALELVKSEGHEEPAKEIQSHLHLYKENQPYRQE